VPQKNAILIAAGLTEKEVDFSAAVHCKERIHRLY
jgi:hypothetical protein